MRKNKDMDEVVDQSWELENVKSWADELSLERS